uniref:NR LBD domain-containing protein n=1 Tax=Caenorhabditis japonica TaxID=281687 RepID=A0A8R1DK30_CAEJA
MHVPQSVNYKQVNKMMIKEFSLVSDWISSSFPQLMELEQDQKDLLTRNFYLKFYVLECGFIACQKGHNRVFFLPNGNYINCQNLESYFTDPEERQSLSPEDAARMFGGSCSSHRRNVTSPMLNEKVDRFEFLALAVLVLFDTGLDGQSDNCMDMCLKIRRTVQREMLQYYSSQENDEFSIRMGNLLSILPNLQKSTDKMCMDIEMTHLFNCYSPGEAFLNKCMGKN